MEKMTVEYPIPVFIDTQVFINEAYNFGKKGKFELIKKHVKKGKIKLLTSDIILREIECHIKKDVTDALEELNSCIKNRKLAIFRDSNQKALFEEYNAEKLSNEALEIFHNYFDEVNPTYLNIENIKLTPIINDYFEGNPPFGKRNKKMNSQILLISPCLKTMQNIMEKFM